MEQTNHRLQHGKVSLSSYLILINFRAKITLNYALKLVPNVQSFAAGEHRFSIRAKIFKLGIKKKQ